MKFIIGNSAVNELDKSKFLGFTIDADQFEGDYHTSCLEELNNEKVINLCRELRPATIRIGGSGIEKMYFLDKDPEGNKPLPENFHFSMDKEKCDALGEFCKKVGAELMLSFPVKYGDVENATRFADYFINVRKDQVPFLEFGNEPDWGWGELVTTYPEKVRKFYEAMTPLFPGKQWIAGYGGRNFPGGVCSPDNTEYMNLLKECGDFIDIFSAHYYVTSSRKPYASLELMMGEFGANIENSRINDLRGLFELFGLNKQVAINEFNSFANKGLEGVSTTMAAATWLADFIGNLAKSGAYVNNIQCGFAKHHGDQPFWRYSMIDTRDGQCRVKPHYYAFYLWSRMMGSKVLPVYAPPSHPVTVHATLSEENADEVCILVVNKDLKDSVDVCVRVLDRCIDRSIQTYELCAESPTSEFAGINGITVNEDGIMNKIMPLEEGTIFEGSINVSVKPCSVKLIKAVMKK